jgi:hypothetical protein
MLRVGVGANGPRAVHGPEEGGTEGRKAGERTVWLRSGKKLGRSSEGGGSRGRGMSARGESESSTRMLKGQTAVGR